MINNNSNGDTVQTVCDIDRIIHEPARFLIMANLFTADEADFLCLQQQTGLTRGNLSSHLNKLENAGFVKIEKLFVDRIPKTLIHITNLGRAAFKVYRHNIKQILATLPE